jgi:hypothetical protein
MRRLAGPGAGDAAAPPTFEKNECPPPSTGRTTGFGTDGNIVPSLLFSLSPNSSNRSDEKERRDSQNQIRDPVRTPDRLVFILTPYPQHPFLEVRGELKRLSLFLLS